MFYIAGGVYSQEVVGAGRDENRRMTTVSVYLYLLMTIPGDVAVYMLGHQHNNAGLVLLSGTFIV